MASASEARADLKHFPQARLKPTRWV